jgi:hypothetical protein
MHQLYTITRPSKYSTRYAKNESDITDARLLRGIIRRNKTIAAFDLSANFSLGDTGGGVRYTADGLDRNSTLLKIGLSFWPFILALASFSERWNRAATTTRILILSTTRLLEMREQVTSLGLWGRRRTRTSRVSLSFWLRYR